MTRGLLGLMTLALLLGCTAGPDYRRPDAPVPARYKEAEGWKRATPRDAGSHAAWWAPFEDPLLDALQQRIDVSNQSLRAAEAAFRQLRAVARGARAGLFPNLGVDTTGQRSGGSGSTGNSSSSQRRTTTTGDRFEISGSAAWEIDLWGRVRRGIESGVTSAQASAGDIAAVRLSLQIELADAYLQLRIADELKRILDAAAVAYAQSLRIATNQYAAGVVPRSDVLQAQTQLETTRAQAIGVGVQRATLEHAIALLVGQSPAEFTIPPAPMRTAVPEIPLELPSELLERRPDIAAAERRMAAANAQIGVAEAAFFPTITLSGSVGSLASRVGDLGRAGTSLWSFGADIAQSIFDGGARSAEVERARAAWDGAVANYRQVVLTSFQQVEDQIAALRILAQQGAMQALAVRSAREAERLALNQYQAGTVAFTTVITAQTARLGNEQAALGVLQSRLLATANLVGALGGGWRIDQLPASDRLYTVPSLDPTAPKPSGEEPGFWSGFGEALRNLLPK